MGLTAWRRASKGKIYKSDVTIAKNYLQKDEIKKLNHIVDMYLDYAELQASKAKPMYMKDWALKLDAFLQFNEEEILSDKGKISRIVAAELAVKEYETFRYIVKNAIYPSCTDCSLREVCDFTKNTEFDCWGNHPSCGDCLWARSLIQCP